MYGARFFAARYTTARFFTATGSGAGVPNAVPGDAPYALHFVHEPAALAFIHEPAGLAFED